MSCPADSISVTRNRKTLVAGVEVRHGEFVARATGAIVTRGRREFKAIIVYKTRLQAPDALQRRVKVGTFRSGE